MQEVFGLSAMLVATKFDEYGHEGGWTNVKANPNTRRGKGTSQTCESMEHLLAKQRVTRKECERLREEFEVGGFMAQKGVVAHCWKKKRMLEDSSLSGRRRTSDQFLRRKSDCSDMRTIDNRP